MRKWLKRLFIGAGILVLVLFLAVYFGGRWAAEKYLAGDIKVGEGKARLVAPRFRWSLDLKADSAIYLSPSLDARAGRTVVSADLFRSLIRFAPSARLEVDTLNLALKPAPDTAARKPKPDSAPAFPDLKLPAAIRVEAGRIAIADTGGPLVRGDGVLLETNGKRGVTLAIREVEARQLAGIGQSLAVSASWADSAQVLAYLVWRHRADSLAVEARLDKRDLRRGAVALRAAIASSVPYARALGMAPTLPRAESFQARLDASLDSTLRIDGSVDAAWDGFPDTAAYDLEALRTSFRIGFRDSSGSWSLEGDGAQGERIDLKGAIFLTARDSLGDPTWLARHAGVTAEGPVRGIRVLAGGKPVRADLRILDLKASSRSLSLDARTGESSYLRADLKPAPAAAKPLPPARSAPAQGGFALPPWEGAFAADIKPGERWVTAFADTNVSFRKFALAGRMRKGALSARLDAIDLKAYGLLADSLRLEPRIAGERFTLGPSHLYYRKADWVLTGEAGLGARKDARFRLAHPDFGKAEFRMPRQGRLQASADRLALARLPYRGLDSLQAVDPRLTAEFDWDQPGKSGRADVRAQGAQKGQPVAAEAHATWTAALLEAKQVKASVAGSELSASARIRLHGRQFFELAGTGAKDVEEARISSRGFDLAKAMRLAMPAPPLKSGKAAGSLSYTPEGGFQGTYRIQDLKMSDEEAKVGIKDLSLTGKGDSLIVRTVTVSDEALFNDTLTLAASGLLGPKQGLALSGRIGPGLILRFDGTLAGFRDLEGKLRMGGNAALPGASGELRNLALAADIRLPMKDGIKGLRVAADTLKGDYHVPGLDTQSFSAPVVMSGGKISVPAFRLRGKGGNDTLRGRFDFDPAAKRFTGSLAGTAFAARFGEGDQVKLRELKVEIRADSTELSVNAAIGSGSAEHIKPPLRVAGDFSRVGVLYRAPLGEKARLSPARGGGAPYLRVRATLDSSEVRYRLRSLETLQNLFKRTPEKRVAKRDKSLQVQIDVATDGSGNSVETDILRMKYVGNFSMAGLYPYALAQGRISSSEGELGPKKQAYAIRNMDLKWLNRPLEEGQLALEARKRLARDCEAGTTDSCHITTHLTGGLADLHFTYDSDCQSNYGGGVEVAALIYSVRRGCYSTAFSAGGSGLSRQEQALGLLEPFASQYLSEAVGKLSGHWIASTQVSGLGALATDKKKAGAGSDSGSAAAEAISLEILSKEFWRTRLRLKSAYAPENADAGTPWNYRAALEWRPPVPPFVESERWRQRIRDNVNVEAAIYTNPDRTQDESSRGDGLLKRLGLNYLYGFWGSWWARKGAIPKPAAPAADKAASDSSGVAIPETIE